MPHYHIELIVLFDLQAFRKPAPSLNTNLSASKSLNVVNIHSAKIALYLCICEKINSPFKYDPLA